MIAWAQMEHSMPVRLLFPPRHYEKYTNVGLVAAARKIPKDAKAGADPGRGRSMIRRLLQRERQGMPLLLVSDAARWTLNGFAGGFARVLKPGGVFSEDPEQNVYAWIFEGLEAFAGLLEVGSPDEQEDARNYAVTRDGRRYVSILGNRGR